MSYARFGDGCSDVYVFLDVGGYLTCCACGIYIPKGKLSSFTCTTSDEMIQHLREHQSAGHQVEEHTFKNLLADAKENDDWIAEQARSKAAKEA